MNCSMNRTWVLTMIYFDEVSHSIKEAQQRALCLSTWFKFSRKVVYAAKG